MNKLLWVGCLVSAMAMAQGTQSSPSMKSDQGMMTGWTPRKVTKEDKKGVEMMLDTLHKAWTTGD
jgi:hypothetical protein